MGIVVTVLYKVVGTGGEAGGGEVGDWWVEQVDKVQQSVGSRMTFARTIV